MTRRQRAQDCNEIIVRLRRDLCELKLLVNDQLSSQVHINCEMRAQLETMKLGFSKLRSLNNKMKILTDKYKEQTGAVKLLTKLLRGKWENHHCECGRLVKILSREERKEEIKSHQDDDDKEENLIESVDTSIQNDENLSESVETAIQTDDVVSGAEAIPHRKFTYTEKQFKTINNKLNHPEWSQYGPVDRLNDDGEWRFELSDCESDCWYKIVKKIGDVAGMWSRPVQLFNELSGLVMIVALVGQSKLPENKFGIFLFAPECKENSSIELPVDLRVQFKVSLLKGVPRSSENLKLTIKRLRPSSLDVDPASLCEPPGFLCSFEGTNRNRLPEIIFKFSTE